MNDLPNIVDRHFQVPDTDSLFDPAFTSPFYDRIVDVMEELMKFTWLIRDRSGYLTDRYSERKESAEEVSKRVNQRAM
ncbi:hypothetical protein GCM10007160_07610 [Litchfieldella qijiaojingensis]|uniref:Uncharacterized protein n=1 Tax=Litchfieldella qijiaojingensis TaxID=980347 RepID=A0ABQ2YI03_9GAMM|nr:hypothetical protein GCM10007160_07610 [Halomonas qijiaojingensis]